jgi:hypothetical protein
MSRVVYRPNYASSIDRSVYQSRAVKDVGCSGRILSNLTFQHSPGGTEEKMENLSQNPVAIRSGYLTNTSIKHGKLF